MFSLKKVVSVTQMDFFFFFGTSFAHSKLFLYSLEGSWELNSRSSYFLRDSMIWGSNMIWIVKCLSSSTVLHVSGSFLCPLCFVETSTYVTSLLGVSIYKENWKRWRKHVYTPHIEFTCFSSANSLHTWLFSHWVISPNSCLGLETKMLVGFQSCVLPT